MGQSILPPKNQICGIYRTKIILIQTCDFIQGHGSQAEGGWVTKNWHISKCMWNTNSDSFIQYIIIYLNLITKLGNCKIVKLETLVELTWNDPLEMKSIKSWRFLLRTTSRSLCQISQQNNSKSQV